MLFSREDVATLINRRFEASWEMVRPAPIIRIDFGNDRIVTRTLHGNVASYVCAADGQIVDVLPGIYTPAVYRAALDQLRTVAATTAVVPALRHERLTEYHRNRVQVLRDRPQRIAFPAPAAAPADLGKSRIELRTEQVIVQAPGNGAARNVRPAPGSDLAQWPLLAVDTWQNESERRLRIHERLAEAGAFRPEQLKRWLYREVLHVDLDDPYLGLGDALIDDDVFREVTG